MDTTENNSLSTPKAILIGLIIIAVVIAGGFVYLKRYVDKVLPVAITETIKGMQPDPSNMPPVSADDYILGKATAPVKIVIYTDLECPFCKQFHQSVDALKDNYIKDGKVAVVYRLFPLDIHPKSPQESAAAMCAGKLGGNDMFWQYVDKVFAATPSNNGLDLNLLPTFATQLGLDLKAFNACTKDKTITNVIDQNLQEGAKAGAQGTPYPIITYKNKVMGALQGAVPADQLKKIVDQVTSQGNNQPK